MPIKMYNGIKDDIGKMNLFQWEKELFILSKCRNSDRICRCCNKNIIKGCYYYGDRRGYYRICINCYLKFMNNLTNSLKELTKTANNSIKNHRKKEGILIKNNLVNTI